MSPLEETAGEVCLLSAIPRTRLILSETLLSLLHSSPDAVLPVHGQDWGISHTCLSPLAPSTSQTSLSLPTTLKARQGFVCTHFIDEETKTLGRKWPAQDQRAQ